MLKLPLARFRHNIYEFSGHVQNFNVHVPGQNIGVHTWHLLVNGEDVMVHDWRICTDLMRIDCDETDAFVSMLSFFQLPTGRVQVSQTEFTVKFRFKTLCSVSGRVGVRHKLVGLHLGRSQTRTALVGYRLWYGSKLQAQFILHSKSLPLKRLEYCSGKNRVTFIKVSLSYICTFSMAV